MSKRLNKTNLWTITAVAVLVGTEILAAALAAGWAVGGLFQLGREVSWAIIALCLVLGAWASWQFVKSALKVEPIYE
ncbi:MAG: hypothetical protein LCH61_12955 [Proteobacteria bacterium]|nr:hypothetical protein [Pseudomonadota bacterium]